MAYGTQNAVGGRRKLEKRLAYRRVGGVMSVSARQFYTKLHRTAFGASRYNTALWQLQFYRSPLSRRRPACDYDAS